MYFLHNFIRLYNKDNFTRAFSDVKTLKVLPFFPFQRKPNFIWVSGFLLTSFPICAISFLGQLYPLWTRSEKESERERGRRERKRERSSP